MNPRALLCAVLLFGTLSACGGSGSGDDSSVPPPPPPPPPAGDAPPAPTVLATHAGDGEIQLTWVGISRATSYNVYWSTQPGLPADDRILIANVPKPYLHTGLTNGIVYYYLISAVNADGESVSTVELQAMPAAGLDANIGAPVTGDLVGGSVPINAQVHSTFAVTSVTARIGESQTDLTFANAEEWTGEVDVSAVDRGDVTLVLSVTDVNGQMLIDSKTVRHDELPVLQWTEPLEFSVARPSLPIVASCSDDDPAGCVSIRVTVSETNGGDAEILFDEGGAPVDDMASLAAFEGREAVLAVGIEDSAGQSLGESRHVFVESSTRLVEIDSAGGRIWDADDQRALYADEAPGYPVLKIHDRVLGVDTIVFDDPDADIDDSHLSPFGAILAQHPHLSPDTTILESREGALIDLGPTVSDYGVNTIAAAGDFALWLAPFDPPDWSLTRRDLRNGISLVVAINSGSCCEISTDGDVVFAEGFNTSDIFRYEDGVLETLTVDGAGGEFRNTNPRTDGSLVAYQKIVADSDPSSYILALHDGNAETLITSASATQPYPYLVSNGFVAYHGSDSLGLSQVWVRFPDGTLTQVTEFNAFSSIEALSTEGDLALSNDGRRYITRPPYDALDDVSSDLGDGPIFWSEGKLILAIGRSLFEVTPQ